ncbi:MAG: hypothetical protein R3A52_10775 [Polyangiales bacterium]
MRTTRLFSGEPKGREMLPGRARRGGAFWARAASTQTRATCCSKAARRWCRWQWSEAKPQP